MRKIKADQAVVSYDMNLSRQELAVGKHVQINPADVAASFRNGVPTVTVPKSAQTQNVHKIEIKAA